MRGNMRASGGYMIYVIYVDLKSSDGKEKKKLFNSDQEAWDWVKKHDGKDIDFRASNINSKMIKDSKTKDGYDKIKIPSSSKKAKEALNLAFYHGFKKGDVWTETGALYLDKSKGNYKALLEDLRKYDLTLDSKSGVHRITYKDIDGIKQSEIIQGDIHDYNKRLNELKRHDCKILKEELFINWAKDSKEIVEKFSFSDYTPERERKFENRLKELERNKNVKILSVSSVKDPVDKNFTNKEIRYIMKDALPMTYTIKVSKFKDDKLRIDVENEYWDKRDYAFYDPKNAKIYSYSSLAADFVDDALKALKIKPSSLKAGMQIRKKVNDALPVKPYFDPLYKDTRRAIVKEVEKYLGEKKLNNSTGKYDKVVWGVRSLLEKTLLSPGSSDFVKAVRSETDRLLKKYNLTKDAAIFKPGDKFKNKNGAILEIDYYDKNGDVQYRLNKQALSASEKGLNNFITKNGYTKDASYFENSNGTKYEVLMKSNSGKHGLLKSPSGQYIVAYNMRNDSWDQGHYFGSDYEKAKKFFLKGYVKDEAMEKEYSYSIKIGGDLKRVKVKANNSDEALEKVKKEAIRFKADRVKTKFDNNKLSTRDLR